MGSDDKYKVVQEKFKGYLKNTQKLLILGIGENRMGDDGAGQYITFELDQTLNNSKVKIINGGIVPEERLSEIVDFKPELMIIIDVIDTKQPSGSVNFYEADQMLNYLPISVHSLPLPVFVDRCERKIPGLKIKLLGICPFSLEFLEEYQLFREDEFSLDDKEDNPNIPFYNFNLTEHMENICKDLIEIFIKEFEKF